jgi:hypothetical protein
MENYLSDKIVSPKVKFQEVHYSMLSFQSPYYLFLYFCPVSRADPSFFVFYFFVRLLYVFISHLFRRGGKRNRKT